MADPQHLEGDRRRLAEIARRFAANDVRFVVIGSWSLLAHFPELAYQTNDIDFIVAVDPENYDKLAQVLNELGVRETRGGTPMKDHAQFSGQRLSLKEHWRLYSEFGIFDLMVDAPELPGFEHLVDDATSITVDGTSILIANYRNVMASKAGAGRRKDRDLLDQIASLDQDYNQQAANSPQPDPIAEAVSAIEPAKSSKWQEPKMRCGETVKSTGQTCLLRKGHLGRHRSRLRK